MILKTEWQKLHNLSNTIRNGDGGIKISSGTSDTDKTTNIAIIRLPEGYKKESGARKLFKEIMVEIFPSLSTDMNLHIQKAE